MSDARAAGAAGDWDLLLNLAIYLGAVGRQNDKKKRWNRSLLGFVLPTQSLKRLRTERGDQ